MCKKNRIAEKFYFDESGFRSSGETVLTRNTGRSGMSLQCGLSNVPSNTRASLPHGPSLRESDHKTPKKSKSERVLVTKVHGFRVTRDVTIAPAFRWEVAYEIALLLVHKHKIEERRILLTTRDLKELLNDLCERSRDSVLQSFYRQLQDHAQTLPSFHHVSKQNACSAKIVAGSVARVDSILRSLAMEPSAVNSRSLKRTLGLDVEQPTVQDISWWKLPKRDVKGDTHVLPSGRVVFRQVRPIPNDINVDEWVRVWLIQTSKNCQMQQATSSSWQMQAKFLVLRRPWFLMSGVGVAAALLYPISQAYQKSMLSLVVRADVLAASWCVAYWYGRRKGVEQAKQQRFAALQASARGIPRISTISPQVVVASPAISSPHRLGTAGLPMSPVASGEEELPAEEFEDSGIDGEDVDSMGEEIGTDDDYNIGKLSSPLPRFSETNESTGWSEPPDPSIFRVRGSSYLEDRIKVPSGPSPFKCRGVDIWMTDNPERHIARHPSVLGGKLQEEDTFLVNFLLPFANFVSYFSVPPLKDFPNKQVADVWTKFLNGDQQYRDARLKLLPVVVEGPWIVKTAVGNGSAPALLGKAIPLQYYFQKPDGKRKGVYEVDVIITASTIAKGILNVVKGHTNSLAIAFALIIEASEKEELPETVLCSFQVHFLNLEDCPMLPTCNLDDTKE
jgi:Protein ENHANCED DISEASE RESISTANCE 2, C-terminal